jgi:MFS family permease
MKYLGLSWTATFLQLALRLSWGVIAVTFAYTLHLNSVEIGTVLFLFYAGYVASSIPWGTLIDKVGPNKVITLSTITSGILLLPILLINNIFQLYAIYLAEGVLTAGLFPSSVKIVSSLERPLTPYLALLESAAPIVLLMIALASGFIMNYWKEFYVILFIALIVTGLSSHLVRVNARKGKDVRRVFNRDIAKVSLIRGGELWGTWGASSWLFPFLVLYDGIPKNESEVLFVLYAVGQVLSIIINNKISTRVRDLTLVRTSLIVFILSVIFVSFLRYFTFL